MLILGAPCGFGVNGNLKYDVPGRSLIRDLCCIFLSVVSCHLSSVCNKQKSPKSTCIMSVK